MRPDPIEYERRSSPSAAAASTMPSSPRARRRRGSAQRTAPRRGSRSGSDGSRGRPWSGHAGAGHIRGVCARARRTAGSRRTSRRAIDEPSIKTGWKTSVGQACQEQPLVAGAARTACEAARRPRRARRGALTCVMGTESRPRTRGLKPRSCVRGAKLAGPKHLHERRASLSHHADLRVTVGVAHLTTPLRRRAGARVFHTPRRFFSKHAPRGPSARGGTPGAAAVAAGRAACRASARIVAAQVSVSAWSGLSASSK